MSKKSLIVLLGLSGIVMGLLLNWVYDFQITWLYLSNVMFVVGVAFFFPGLIIYTGAGGILSSAVFLTKKVFSNPKKSADHLDSYNDFLVHRNAQTQGYNLKAKGKVVMILGALYIGFSILIGYML